MLINCTAYQEGTKLRDISIAKISDYVSHPNCPIGLVVGERVPANRRRAAGHQVAVRVHDIRGSTHTGDPIYPVIGIGRPDAVLRLVQSVARRIV